MKKLHLMMMLALMIASLSVSTNSFAAITDSTDYEVRTTGAATNGGGYYPRGGASVDYSQQDAAQLSLTDLATSGTTVTTLTSVTGGFTAAMVGNIIQIHTGTNLTAGFYEITVYTDTNTVTLDRAPDDGVGGVSAGQGSVGGALDSPEYLTGISSVTLADQSVVFIKSGTYTLGSTWTVGCDSAYDDTMIIGYKTTRYDRPLGDDRPLLDANGNVNCVAMSPTHMNVEYYFENIRFTGGTGDCFNSSATNYTHPRLINCKVSNGGDKNIQNGGGVDGGYALYYTEVNNATSDGFYPYGDAYAYWCYFHDNGASGADSNRSSADWYQEYTIWDTNGSLGCRTAGYFWYLKGCIAYNNQGDGYAGDIWGDTSHNLAIRWYVRNNIFHDNGAGGAGYGFDNDSSDTWRNWDYNCYEGNATGGTDGVTAGSSDITDDPLFTDAANGDFSFQSGSPCLGTGWGGTLWNGVSGAPKHNMGLDNPTAAGGGSSSGSVSVSWQ